MIALKDLFLNKLAEMCDAERLMVQALPKMALAAMCADLTRAILSILKETGSHVTKLDQVFECFDATARSNTCKATAELLAESDEIAKNFKGSPSINAVLLSTAQRIEHNAMASYDRLREWAVLLGNKEAASLLQEMLEGEKASNELLSKLARASSHQVALGESAEAGLVEATQKKPGTQQTFTPPVSASRNRAGLRSQQRPCNREMVARLSDTAPIH